MTLPEHVAAARAALLQLEREAATLGDDELDGRVACARLALLDVGDRVAQLRVEELERAWYGDPDELEAERYAV